jgi:hypothetical protein
VQTIYDLVTIVIFAGLAILFLQRSTEPETPKDKMYYYLPPGLGCALANYLGNHHYDVLAVGMIVAVLVYTYFVLKPFNVRP